MSERHFEDFEIGERFASPGITVSESQILDFALAYDPQPFHLDKEAAAKSPYGGLIASGFHTLALAFRAFYQANVINHCSLGSPGMDEVRWLKPVIPGDTLHTEAEVRSKREVGLQAGPRRAAHGLHDQEPVGRGGHELHRDPHPGAPARLKRPRTTPMLTRVDAVQHGS